MRWTIALALSFVLALSGCAKDRPAKEQATRDWNAARARVLGGLARDQFEAGDLGKATNTVGEALSLDPTNAALHVLSARMAMEKNQLEQADRSLKLARQFNPKDAECDYLSGVIYQRWQKPEQAMGFYASAAAKNPTELAYVMAQSEMLVELDRTVDARSLLEAKLAYFEHSPAIRDAIGQLYMQEGKYAQAAEILRQAAILATDDLQFREHLAFAQLYSGNHRDAAGNFERLLSDDSLQNRSDLHAALGQCWMNLGMYREARASFETATGLEPGSAGLWRMLGESALRAKDLQRADLALRRSAAIDPRNPQTQLLLGYSFLQRESLAKALAAFQSAAALDPADTTAPCMIGYTLAKLGRAAEAVEYYAAVLRQHPDDELAAGLMASVEVNP